MSDFRNSLEQNLKNPEFKAEWDALEIEYQVQEALMRARIEAQLTQAQLSELSGVRQSNISRIENGNSLPRLDTLALLAHAMGKSLKISIE